MTRYVAAGSTVTPLILIVDGSTRLPSGPDALHVYVKPPETWRTFGLVPWPSHCCSSARSIWAPVSVMVTRLLPNGWTANASAKVISPASMSVRMPPGFMNATTALPVVALAVSASWESAMTSPRTDSPAAFCSRVSAAVVAPMRLLAIGAEIAVYLSMMAVWAGSLATSCVTIEFVAETETTWPVRLSMRRLASVSTRPKDDALVAGLPAITQL